LEWRDGLYKHRIECLMCIRLFTNDSMKKTLAKFSVASPYA
jgi:hypothetical protein